MTLTQGTWRLFTKRRRAFLFCFQRKGNLPTHLSTLKQPLSEWTTQREAQRDTACSPVWCRGQFLRLISTALPGSFEACPLAGKPLKGSACPELEFPLWRRSTEVVMGPHYSSRLGAEFLFLWIVGEVKVVKTSCGSCQENGAKQHLLCLPSREACKAGASLQQCWWTGSWAEQQGAC